MQVKAINKGYYNLRIQEEGSVFAIKSEAEFSSDWMEKLEAEEKPVKGKKGALPKAKAQDLDLAIDKADVI